MFSTPEETIRAFCAYPFTTARKEFYEKLRASLPRDIIELYLPHLDYQPAMIWSRLRPEINAARLCIIDSESINPNVAFECGYAIAKGVYPILIRHHDAQVPVLPYLQAFEYLPYYTRHDLLEPITKLATQTDWRARLAKPMDDIAGVSPDAYLNLAPHTEIYLLAVRARQDPVLRLKKELAKRPYSVESDAIESSVRIPTRDIIKSIIRFNNIAIHLVGETRSPYDELLTLNSAASFFAGIAHGLGKEVRVFQQMPTPKQILDLETMLSTYHTEAEIAAAARSWIQDFTARATAFEERRKAADAVLAPLGTTGLPPDLGDPWAERDGMLNEATFTITSRTSRIRNGEGILYVGPRGCGKTADFLNLSSQQASTATRLTVAVKLTDADIISLRGIGQELFSRVDRHNIYRHIWRLALIALILDEYERLKAKMAFLEPLPALETLSQQLNRIIGSGHDLELAELVDSLISNINTQTAEYRNSQELIRTLAFPAGRSILAAAIKSFEIRIAIDGLDQGWDPKLKEATELLVALVDEAHDLEQRHRPQLKIAIFALQELYREISAEDRDRDKRSVEYYSWDNDQLADLIGARILAVTSGQPSHGDPRDAWPLIFEPNIDGSSTYDYIVDRSLMRPRHVLRFCREALIRANNRRHLRVDVSDILESEEIYSGQLIDDLAVEYSDRYPGIGGVILEFLEASSMISYEDIRERVNAMFAANAISDDMALWLKRDDNDRVLVALKALYEVGFIGVIRDHQVIYSYMQTGFDRVWPLERRDRARRRRRSRRRQAPQHSLRYPRLMIHPAFHKGLAISGEPTA